MAFIFYFFPFFGQTRWPNLRQNPFPRKVCLDLPGSKTVWIQNNFPYTDRNTRSTKANVYQLMSVAVWFLKVVDVGCVKRVCTPSSQVVLCPTSQQARGCGSSFDQGCVRLFPVVMFWCRYFEFVQKLVDQKWFFFSEWKYKIQINSDPIHFYGQYLLFLASFLHFLHYILTLISRLCLYNLFGAFKSYRPHLKLTETDWSTNEFVGISLPVWFSFFFLFGKIIPIMRFKLASKAPRLFSLKSSNCPPVRIHLFFLEIKAKCIFSFSLPNASLPHPLHFNPREMCTRILGHTMA